MEELYDTRNAQTRVELGMARAEFAQQSATRAFAEQISAIHATLGEARDNPEVCALVHAPADASGDAHSARL